MGFGRVEITFILCEAVCILFYGLFTEFNVGTSPKTQASEEDSIRTFMHDKYAMFQDVHVMIFIGFGFLMVFLKNNSWTSIGFNYLIACWAIQITILFRGFWLNVCEHYHDSNHKWTNIKLNISELILADFGAGAVLISFGAILGKCSLFQLWAMATIECFFYALNESICVDIFGVSDIGGSMTIHTFGAYFGLSVALFYQPKIAIKDKNGIGVGNYLSDLISMIGTLFLFAFWPSFNAALGTTGSQQQRTVINTYLSISSSVIASIISSKIIHHGKLEMEIVLNASIAGGVAIGATADMIVLPFGSMIVGFIAGTVSSFGFAYLSAILKKAINLHDTCGVHNLHGMPGVIGGLTSAIIASRSGDNFGANYGNQFVIATRSPSEQAGYQLASLALTLGIAITTGLFAGFVTSRQWFQPPSEDYMFDDRFSWENCEIEHEQMAVLQRQMTQSQSKLINNSNTARRTEKVEDYDEDAPENSRNQINS